MRLRKRLCYQSNELYKKIALCSQTPPGQIPVPLMPDTYPVEITTEVHQVTFKNTTHQSHGSLILDYRWLREGKVLTGIC